MVGNCIGEESLAEFAGVVLGFMEESKDATALPSALTVPRGLAFT